MARNTHVLDELRYNATFTVDLKIVAISTACGWETGRLAQGAKHYPWRKRRSPSLSW